MKKIFLIVIALLFSWELYRTLPDLLAMKIQDVKVFDTVCIESEDGLFYPKVSYEGGEEFLTKEGFNNPEKCQARYGALKNEKLPLFRRALGGVTLDPSISYKSYVHFFLLIIAALYVYTRFPDGSTK